MKWRDVDASPGLRIRPRPVVPGALTRGWVVLVGVGSKIR